MNNWNFTGNLGHSAEQKDAGGTSLVTFSVAVKAGYGKNETTTWARCNMWGTRGEAVLPFLKKGQLVGICGEVSLHEWAGKDGTAKAGIEVRVNDLTLLGKRDDAAPVTEHSAAKANAYQKQPIDVDEDISF